MDNVFEILIYIIIIISFLSSLFRKKQQPQKKPQIKLPQQDDYYSSEKTEKSSAEPRKDEYDILREIEDFFKVGNEMKTTIPGKDFERADRFGEHIRTESEETTNSSELKIDVGKKKSQEVKKQMESVEPAVAKQAALFESYFEKMEHTYSNIALLVKSKLEDPDSLKEYIIFSEILGKPKAFRR